MVGEEPRSDKYIPLCSKCLSELKSEFPYVFGQMIDDSQARLRFSRIKWSSQP